MENNKKTPFLYIPFLLAIAIILGFFLGKGLPNKQRPLQAKSGGDIQKLESIIRYIDQRYVDEVDPHELVEKSIQKLLKDLDPHSAYIPPVDYDLAQERINGEFGGVGIRFLIHNDTLVVTHTIAGGPSQQSGIKAGDRIITVDSANIAGIKLENRDVQKKLKGKPGTPVLLSILRKGKIIEKNITRGVIPLNSIETYYMLNEETGYLKLSNFARRTADEFSKATQTLKLQGMKHLIFDLRGNGGGLLSAAIDIIDEFLPAGKLIVYTEGNASPRRDYIATSRGQLEDVKVSVLINSSSASASEIVAGALQDNDRGMIYGRRSFGKGLVQEQTEAWNDGSAILLTIARYYTPTGRCIQKPYGEGINYQEDYYNRIENGEHLKVDSSLFVDSLRFETPEGRFVYGGGGIMPDVFIPSDTTSGSFFLNELFYKLAFDQYSFKFLDLEREHIYTKYGSSKRFNEQFVVDDKLYNSFISYSADKLEIKGQQKEQKRSKETIKQFLKAKIADQLWENEGYYRVRNEDDEDILKAL